MAQALQPVRGTHDLLAEDFAAHQYVTVRAQEIAGRYGYGRIDTPIFEFSEVFHRAVGDTSDIVTKETYTFEDRGRESITLRPEFTAAIVRAYVSNGLQQFSPFKCFYAGPAFRYERPQKGRQRQFHQFGAELLGAAEPTADVEMIALAMHMLEALGLSHTVRLEINSLGDTGSRAAYRESLVGFLAAHKNDLSEDSQKRLDKNPLRILDSKDARDRDILENAPTLHSYFSEESQNHFNALKKGLDALKIPYAVNEKLVRGLDYYSHTVFEIVTDQLGAQGTVIAGGRYDGLVELMGGQPTPGIGFAAGIERLVALMAEIRCLPQLAPAADVAVVPMQESADIAAFAIAQSLRHAGFKTDIAYKGKGGKRMEKAGKSGARVAVVIGDDEMAKGAVTIKQLTSSAAEKAPQTTLPLDQLIPTLRGLLG